jgi:hypothetical protein
MRLPPARFHAACKECGELGASDTRTVAWRLAREHGKTRRHATFSHDWKTGGMEFFFPGESKGSFSLVKTGKGKESKS